MEIGVITQAELSRSRVKTEKVQELTALIVKALKKDMIPGNYALKFPLIRQFTGETKHPTFNYLFNGEYISYTTVESIFQRLIEDKTDLNGVYLKSYNRVNRSVSKGGNRLMSFFDFEFESLK